jgi:hypothetical protein
MTKQKPKDWSVPILVAVIGLIGTWITAFFAIPGFQNWVSSFFTPPNSKSLAIEQIPQRIFSYCGETENLGGFAKLEVIFGGTVIKTHYFLNYTIPLDRDGYAGMVFQFNKGQDVADYSAIVLNIQFSEGNIPIDLFVKDIGDNGDHIRITSKGTEETTFRYDLNIFKNVEFNALKEIGFNSDQSMIRGQHTITISGISFVR